MACLVAKNVGGRRYWQIVTSKRVDGKPRQVVLAHLGTADALMERLAGGPGVPQRAKVSEFGLLAAAWNLAAELDIVGTIDRHVPKRNQGPSVGQYLLLAVLNRLSAPTSKAGMGAWYESTTLRRWLPAPAKSLSSQRFWDHMDRLDDDAMGRIEAEITRRLVERFGVDLRCLCFDCTNFDTFIDSRTPSELPQRGHAKSKRTDLRVVGLALLVSIDHDIPLFWRVYPGNQPDSVTMASVTAELVERYRELARQTEHVTLVFDKGNNSEDNLQHLVESPYHVVGSLVPSQHADLLAIPLREFTELQDPRLTGVTAYRTRKEVFGREWAVVVTRSQELLEGQLRGIAQHLRKRRDALDDLQDRVRRSQQPGARGKGYTLESLQEHAARLGRGQYISDILKITVGSRRNRLYLTYCTDRTALDRLTRTVLGKRVLFTDNEDWSTEAIVLAYRSQYHVEAAFRQMKNPHWVSWDPLHHWTDQKIRVHALYCVLALTLAGLLQRQAAHAGLKLSGEAIHNELSTIREVLTLHASGGADKGGRPRAYTSYVEPSAIGRRLADIFGIDRLKAR